MPAALRVRDAVRFVDFADLVVFAAFAAFVDFARDPAVRAGAASAERSQGGTFPFRKYFALGQRSATGHSGHFGFRAWQIRRPWKMRRCEKSIQSSRGRIRMRSCSTSSTRFARLNPRRRETRYTWVSTTTPSATP
jgi:hypothetical protein